MKMILVVLLFVAALVFHGIEREKFYRQIERIENENTGNKVIFSSIRSLYSSIDRSITANTIIVFNALLLAVSMIERDRRQKEKEEKEK
ncbi:MAG: hypothetical protein NZ585_14885 [Chloracidobacterium sp.]|nr:hypothetical protein [Chloracidobacterium sp.]